MDGRKTLRCAIYTRKSVEEGLEQEFNSLDAQRASCEAYIQSRKMEGWVCLPEHYDDGGYSGGNLNRPAFQRLMADAKAGRLDMILVYKIDRMSRSLLDFTDVFREFMRLNVSFASVTQEFNTTTSGGRMMMNILMSFAQYERETTSERVRDKINASKRKGFWPGGSTPYGYRRENKRLVPDPATSGNVRKIYEWYLELGSPKQVVKRLNAAGILRFPEKGGRWDTVSLSCCLRSCAYVGRVKIGDESVPGIHKPILEQSLWDKVQKMLAEVSRGPTKIRHDLDGALLKGILRCGTCGSCMTYRWTRKPNTGATYGYYTDIRSNKQGTACPVERVSAEMVEPVVEREVMEVLRTPTFVRRVAERLGISSYEVGHQLADDAAFWTTLAPTAKRRLVRKLVSQVLVYENRLDIWLKTQNDAKLMKEVHDAHAD